MPLVVNIQEVDLQTIQVKQKNFIIRQHLRMKFLM